MTNANSAMSNAGYLGTETRPGSFWFNLGDTWSRYRGYRVTLSALSALTDRELEDIGYDRANLKVIARAATL